MKIALLHGIFHPIQIDRQYRPERMTTYNVLLFVHILLLVYWLGADLGVMILGKQVKRTDLSFEQRALLLQMAMVIDFTPRMAFIAMFPVGYALSARLGLVPGDAAIQWGLVLVAVAWLLLVLTLLKSEGTPRGVLLQKVQAAYLALLGLLLVALGTHSLLSPEGLFAQDWLAAKVLLFGLICFCAIGIDWAFKPLVVAFPQLAQGSTPELEQTISSSMDRALRFVYALYALLVIIAWLGVSRSL